MTRRSLPRASKALLVAGGAAVLATGCSGAPAGVEGDVARERAPLLTAAPPNQIAFDYFVGKGLTSFQAAGIVGNLDQESQMDPNAVQAGGPGRGIAQWSVGGRWDTDANDNVLWYAGTQGASASSLSLQLDFIWYELQTFSSYGLGALRATTNVTDATIAFETDFEGCGQCDESNRIAYAQAALQAYGAIDYAASYVSQSFPLATTALTMTAGQTLPAYIEMKNDGVKAWDSSTRLGTANPRDRVSAFADASWISPSRAAAVSGTVAPGASYKFAFTLHAPAKPGTYLEYFNLVQEGVAWFSDPGQGGPADDVLEANIVVVAAPEPPSTDGGASGGGASDGGSSHDGGATALDDGGVGSPQEPSAPTGAPTPALDGDGGSSENGVSGGAAAGCALARGAGSSSESVWILGAALVLARRRRRRVR